MGFTGYGKQGNSKALAGQQDAATRAASIDSMVCSAAGNIGYGEMVERDGLPRLVKVFDGTGTVYGISLRSDFKEQGLPGNPGAPYVPKDVVPVIRSGRVWLRTGNSASSPLTIGAAVVGLPTSEVIDVTQDINGDRLALVDIHIP